MTAILPAGMDDSSAPSNLKDQRRQMSKPPERKVTLPWADALFALLAKGAAAQPSEAPFCGNRGTFGDFAVGGVVRAAGGQSQSGRTKKTIRFDNENRALVLKAWLCQSQR